MDDASKQAILSAIRSILIAIGSILGAKGYADDATVQAMIGAVMVILPVLWGVWDKYQAEHKTAAREVVAVNAGIKKADATTGPTPPASPEAAKAIIATFAPEVPQPERKNL